MCELLKMGDRDCSCPGGVDIAPIRDAGAASQCLDLLLKQPVNPVLPASAALVAREPHDLLFGRSFTERVRIVRHRHNQLSRRSARSICAVALSMSASSPMVATMSTSSAA